MLQKANVASIKITYRKLQNYIFVKLYQIAWLRLFSLEPCKKPVSSSRLYEDVQLLKDNGSSMNVLQKNG